MGSCCLPLNQLTHPTMKTFASLIVMVSSACCAQINFLGVPGVPTGYSGYPALSVVPLGVYGAQPTVYTAETVSPSIDPLRTALDTLNTFPNYATAPGFRVTGYPFSNTPAVISTPELVAGGLPIQVVPAPLPAPEDADVLKVVNVAAEETDGNEIAAPGLITVAEEIDELPSPPTSLFRDPTPVIPAGIAQATQPIFHQQLFKNPKLSPFLVQYPNSKISTVLQDIRGHGSIVV